MFSVTRITKLITLMALGLGFATAAHAGGGTDVGFMLGAQNTDFSISGQYSGYSTSSKTGLLAGVIVIGDIGQPVLFRSGAYYSERSAEISASGQSATFKFGYIDVPVTVLYRFNDMFGLFGGGLLGVKVSDSCSGCNGTSTGVKSTYLAAQLGLDVKFDPNWSAEAFYDLGLGDIATDIKANSIGVGVIFTY